MKKLIIIFLLVISGAIYFIGSSCVGESLEMQKSAGVTVDDCTTVAVPKVDFTVDKNEYYVGQTVAYKFTGDKGNARYTFFEWTLPGTADGFSVDENPVVVYPLAGSYTVRLKVRNSCWADQKIMYNYISIFVWPEK
jgi:PKD repeat protein